MTEIKLDAEKELLKVELKYALMREKVVTRAFYIATLACAVMGVMILRAL